MTGLDPCPFCAETAAVLDGKSEDVVVRCEACGARGQMFFFDPEDDDAIQAAEDLAIAAWNTRPTP